MNIPYDNGVVIKNAIDPIPKHEETETKDLQLIYASTPQRGLDILVNALNLIDRSDFHLHVFSSYKLYGWEKNDEPYKPLFEMCEKDPRVTYYGAVPYDELREHWKNMHILAYPSIPTSFNFSAGVSCVGILSWVSLSIFISKWFFSSQPL